MAKAGWSIQLFIEKAWAVDALIDQVSRAESRALIAIGERVVSEAKQVVHRITGTLSRSIHLASPGYSGTADAQQAKLSELYRRGVAVPVKNLAGDLVLLVGSWIDYAGVEASRGGTHDFMTPSVEIAQNTANEVMTRALISEGISD